MSTSAVTKKAAADNSPLDDALIAQGKDIFERDSKNRHAEDREWYLAALFYQLKQWLDYKNGRFEQIPQNPKKPTPMPVTDYFSKTINANANTLGAKIPEMVVTPNDQSPVNRRAAAAAENSFDEMDKESGMDFQNPKLAKHTVLWGLGCTKETVDTSESAGMLEIPGVSLAQLKINSCAGCGYMGMDDTGEPPAPAQPQMPPGNPLGIAPQDSSAPPQPTDDQDNCPNCGGQLDTNELSDIIPGMPEQFPKGKLCTHVIPMLEVYLPRDCRDPNLAKRITHKFRKPESEANSLFPDAGELKADDSHEISQFYMEALRGLVMGSGDKAPMVSFTEIWADWDQLDEDTQEAIEEEWGQLPSGVIGYEQMTRLQACKTYGIYWIFTGEQVVAKCENPWDGKKCFVFYPWEKDPASPYPKGLSVPLIPKQKQLNRLDCTMELSEQTHGCGKLMAPVQQMSNFKPTGNPVDVYWYDQSDGKDQPKFILPTPYSSALPIKRQALIQDFKELGYTQGVSQGDNPGGGVSSFRGIAYLGSKAEENIETQRFLWEQSHQLRKELLLIMIRKIWDEPRKARVSGFNGKFGMMELTGKSVVGDYGIQVMKGSSRPKTREEKMQALQMAVQGGLVDMSDTQTRDYALNELEINELNPADHFAYEKADRDLEKLKAGITPFESPFQKWDIPLKLIAQYSLTEEFEELQPEIQQAIMLYGQYCSDKLTAVTQGVPPDPKLLNKQFAAAAGGNKGNGPQSPLSGVPGKTEGPAAAENAANAEGHQIANHVSPA